MNARQIIEAEDPKAAFLGRWGRGTEAVVHAAFKELNLPVTTRPISGKPEFDEYRARVPLADNAELFVYLTVWRPEFHSTHSLSIRKKYRSAPSAVDVVNEHSEDVSRLLRMLKYAVQFIVPKLDFVGPKEAARQAKALRDRVAHRILVEAEDPKAFLKNVVARPIRVSCYMGHWTADRNTGLVKTWHEDGKIAEDDPLFAKWARSITAFDFDEWEAHWGRPADSEIDICDIGSWTRTGEYEPPEANYRQEQAAREAQQEAEDPKTFFQKQMPIYQIKKATPANRCGICNDRTAYVIGIDGIDVPICRGCHRCGFKSPLRRRPRPRQESEDPKSVFKHLHRATEVTLDDISTEYRETDDIHYAWTAMWKTPFIIANRRIIRGCPAGTGPSKILAVKDLIVQTNKESNTKFYIYLSGDTFPWVWPTR